MRISLRFGLFRFCALCAGLVFLSCSRAEWEETPSSGASPVPAGMERHVFTVAWDEDTRAALSGRSVVWQTGDRVAVWDDVNPQSAHEFVVVEGGSSTAVIEGFISSEATAYVAASPWSAVKGRDGDRILLDLPALRNSRPGETAASTLLSVASGTGNQLTFKNVCALMKFTLSRSDIASVYLTGGSNELLAGQAAVAPDGTMADPVSIRPTVALKPSSGEALEAGTYLLPVFPAAFPSGLYFNVYTTGGRQLRTAFTASLTLGRNAARDAGTLDAGDEYALYYGGRGATKTSSTINYYWDLNSYADRAAARAMPWRATLYRDADCTDPVVSWDIPANAKDGQNNALFGSGEPRFIFTGLAPSTSYWFRATSLETFLTTTVMMQETTAFTPKTMQQTEASAGDIILAEDFSEFPWYGDQVNVGCAGYVPYANYIPGYVSPETSFQVLEGIDPSPRTFQTAGDEARLFRELRNVVSGTRLDTWCETHEDGEPIVCARPGYVKMGAYSRTGSLVTPPLSCIPAGKSATVKVSFKAARSIFGERSYIRVQAVQGTVSPDATVTRSLHLIRAGDSYCCEATKTNGWDSFSCQLAGVTAEDRIAIGGDRVTAGTEAGSAQLRFMLDEIVLTVVSIDEASAVSSRLERATSSTLTFSWSPSAWESASEDAAHPYTFGLYTDKACSTPVVEWSTAASHACWASASPKFIFTGLSANTTYYFKATATDTGLSTSITPATTSAWTNVQVGDWGSASAGKTILAEDFGQLAWYGDVQDGAAGYVADDYLTATTVKKATGVNPSGFTLKKGSDECRLHNTGAGMLNSINTTRMADWAEWDEGSSALVCCHGGYVKLGAAKYTTMYITPRLKSIPTDKKAKLRVSFKAARYASDPGKARIGIFRDDTQISDAHKLTLPSGTYSNLHTDIDITSDWESYSFEVDGVTSSDRIAIGPDRSNSGTTAGTDQLRMLLDEVKIEIISLSDSDYLVVPLSDIGYMKVYHFRENNQYGMVFCPGGGYSTHSNYEVNNWLGEFTSNFTMGIVYYTLPANGTKRDITLADMDKAIALMDTNRASWGGYTKLGITGGSAGGHLCVISAQRNKSVLDFQAPQFAVITMHRDKTHTGSVDQLLGTSPSDALVHQFSAEENVTADMPPAYIAYSKDDTTVPYATNSLWYVNACQEAGAVYRDNPHETGGHAEVNWADWPSAFITWIGTL